MTDSVDGRFIMGVLGCDLAADPIGRQACIGNIRDLAKRGLSCERPALLIVAVEPGKEDAAAASVAEALGGLREDEPGV